jgi:hypothetical protein
MAFARSLPVFDRSGARIGRIERWSTAGPRTYRINQPGDFRFFVPRNDGNEAILTEPALPTLVGSNANSSASANSITYTRPTGTVEGDRLVAFVATSAGGAVVTPPSGWTLEGKARAGGQAINIFTLKVPASNPASYQFTANATGAIGGGVVAYRNAGKFAPILAQTSETSKIKVPRVTAPFRNEWALAVALADRNVSWTSPPGWTNLFGQSVAGLGIRAAHVALDEPGMIAGSQKFTTTTSGQNNLVALIVQQKPSVEALLARDNLIYVANDLNMPGWGGVIEEVLYDDKGAMVHATGTLSTLAGLDVEAIVQDEGVSWEIAGRIVIAARAKQAAKGDLPMEFAVRSTPPPRPNYGVFSYAGDALQGLYALARDTLSEFYTESWIDEATGRLRTKLNWGSEIAVDHRDVLIHDGPGANVTPGTQVSFSNAGAVTYAKLTGAQTRLSEFLNYQSVSAVIKDETPEVSVDLVALGLVPETTRHRELVNFSVNWGYSRALQKQMAEWVEARYVELYKRFLYAWHDRMGKPFLDGYDWGGANEPGVEKQMRMASMRTANVLGQIENNAIVTLNNDPNADIDITITKIALRNTLVVTGATGAAYDYSRPNTHWVAFSDAGEVSRLVGRSTWLLTDIFKIAGPGETLVGISTDAAAPRHLWAVFNKSGGGSVVRRYDMATGTTLASWSVGETLTDIAVDVPSGTIFTANDADKFVSKRDLNNGLALGSYERDGGFHHHVGLGLTGGGTFLYMVANQGSAHIVHARDGAKAGGFGFPYGNITGLYVNDVNSELWVCLPDKIEQYWASVAIAAPTSAGPQDGTPGFDAINNAQFVHIVMAADRRQVGYKVPARPDPPEVPDGGGTDPTPPPEEPPGGGNGGEYEVPQNRQEFLHSLGGRPNLGDRRRSPLTKYEDLPVLAVLHSTQHAAFANATPGIRAEGQGTYDEVLDAADNNHAVYTTYVARNGHFITTLNAPAYAARQVPTLSLPRDLPGIKKIIEAPLTVYYDWGEDEYGRPVRIKHYGDNCKYVSGRGWVCTYVPDEFILRQIGFTAYNPTKPVTDEQMETAAFLIARDAYLYRRQITRGDTVLTHSDLQSVGYSSCPFPAAVRESKMRKIIKRANKLKRQFDRDGLP